MCEFVVPPKKYSRAMRVLHWLVAVLVFITWPLGLIIQFVKDEVKLDFYLLHESFGFLVLWLMLVRLGLRMTTSTPAIEGGRVVRIAAAAVHGLLYLCLIAMPVSGFLATNAHGFALQWFGVLPIWSPLGPSPAIAPVLSTVHTWCAWIVLTLFALHILAVIHHRLIRRDDTLHRIL